MVSERLIEEIAKSGLKKGVIASKLGISDCSLRNKLNGKSDFYVEEAMQLIRMLGFTDKDFSYFFKQKVE